MVRIRNLTIVVMALGSSFAALARSKGSALPTDDAAEIIGDAGERHPLAGSGGIQVRGGRHGMLMSDMKGSVITIDGSGIAAPARSNER